MIRMLITLPESEKQWLMAVAKKEQISTSELVRRIIAAHHEQQLSSKKKNISKLLAKTKGSWKHGDGMEYQQRIRDEWS